MFTKDKVIKRDGSIKGKDDHSAQGNGFISITQRPGRREKLPWGKETPLTQAACKHIVQFTYLQDQTSQSDSRLMNIVKQSLAWKNA